jgi:hypothetical protein
MRISLLEEVNNRIDNESPRTFNKGVNIIDNEYIDAFTILSAAGGKESPQGKGIAEKRRKMLQMERTYQKYTKRIKKIELDNKDEKERIIKKLIDDYKEILQLELEIIKAAEEYSKRILPVPPSNAKPPGSIVSTPVAESSLVPRLTREEASASAVTPAVTPPERQRRRQPARPLARPLAPPASRAVAVSPVGASPVGTPSSPTPPAAPTQPAKRRGVVGENTERNIVLQTEGALTPATAQILAKQVQRRGNELRVNEPPVVSPPNQ